MADHDANLPATVDVQVLPAQSGGVTTLNGTGVVFPAGGQQQPASWPGGSAPPGWGPSWPVVMPQPSVIVVTVDKKDGDKKSEKKNSEVFTRL